MGLRKFIIKRIVYSFILILVVICFNFVIFMRMPGDPTDFLMAAWSKESPESRKAHEQALKDLWGLNEPIEIQLAKYIRNLLSFNFGIEIAGRRPISEVLAQKIPYTVLLLGLSTIISMIIGIFWGIAVIKRRGGSFDTFSVITALITNSLPTFWIGLVLLWIFVGTLNWFPGARAFPVEWALPNVGWPQPVLTKTFYNENSMIFYISLNFGDALELISGYVRHLLLPLITLTIFSFGGWLLLTRATMLETVTEDYIVTARAKGLKEDTILYKHALKNASLPIITSAALSFGFILSGAIITETVFSYPGLGGWIWTAINIRDYTVLMAVFYLISLCVIIANIIADILYGVIDPRIKYG